MQGNQTNGKSASGKQFLNGGLGNTTPIQTVSKSQPQQHVRCNVPLPVEPAGLESTPPSRVSLSSLQDNKEEIGFPGSNFSISRVVLHLHRGEVRLTVGRIPSATWSPNLDGCSVKRTL